MKWSEYVVLEHNAKQKLLKTNLHLLRGRDILSLILSHHYLPLLSIWILPWVLSPFAWLQTAFWRPNGIPNMGRHTLCRLRPSPNRQNLPNHLNGSNSPANNYQYHQKVQSEKYFLRKRFSDWHFLSGNFIFSDLGFRVRRNLTVFSQYVAVPTKISKEGLKQKR